MCKRAAKLCWTNTLCNLTWMLSNIASSNPQSKGQLFSAGHKIRFILVLSFVHLVVNHSLAYAVFCLHCCFSKVSKNSLKKLGDFFFIILWLPQNIWTLLQQSCLISAAKRAFPLRISKPLRVFNSGVRKAWNVLFQRWVCDVSTLF